MIRSIQRFARGQPLLQAHGKRYLSARVPRWQLFNALELREEAERVHLSSFLARLRKLASEVGPEFEPSSCSLVDGPVVLEFVQPAGLAEGRETANRGAEEPGRPEASAEYAYRLLRHFEAGGSIAEADLLELLEMAATLLEDEVPKEDKRPS